MDSSPTKTGFWWIQSCADLVWTTTAVEIKSATVMLHLEASTTTLSLLRLFLFLVQCSLSLREHDTTFHLWLNIQLLFILCVVMSPCSNCDHHQKKVLWTKLTAVSCLEGNSMGRACLSSKTTAIASLRGPISEQWALEAYSTRHEFLLMQWASNLIR